MSGVRRFLSRRDKSPGIRHRHEHDSRENSASKTSRRPDHFRGVFVPRRDPEKRDREEEKKIKGILERLRYYGIDNISESNVEYALHSKASQGDPEAAFRLLMMLEDTYEGIIKPYNPDTKLKGAVNREGITCYLDTLLFAMFAKLDSFEAMLYDNFEDIKRKRLAGLMRLWVNMLRTGRLITTDVTEQIQNALVDCGWRDAGQFQQQDPSEAFTFITGQLELPMLTLKMDMYHRGQEDPQDDHKFVNERLLEVAILDKPPEGRDVVTLEDCLEHYFNNRIEVKRYQEETRRRNTLKSANPPFDPTKVEKESGTHVEVAELQGPETPITASPSVSTPAMEHQTPNFPSPLRPSLGRKRQDSIFSQRKIEIVGVGPETPAKAEDSSAAQDSKLRKMSTRTEVLMPAWQFFKLLPWYTDNMPTSDAQVAAHFSKKRPVLGICLKRYSYTNTGQARRLDTYVDIPTEIDVPNFVSDDSMQEEGPLVGNFRLVLQSVVCHRGTSVHSGHYICLSRGQPPSNSKPTDRRACISSDDPEDPWYLFDDLHTADRIRQVDIHQALKKEMPYLLFYQVLPIGDDPDLHDLPSYTEATSRSQSDAPIPEKPFDQEDHPLNQTSSAPQTHDHKALPTDAPPPHPASARASLDVGSTTDITDSSRRSKSTTLDTASYAGSSRSSDDKSGTTLLSVASKIGSRRVSRGSGTRSRPSSTGPGGEKSGFGLSMTKLTHRISRSENVGEARPSSSSEADANAMDGVQPKVSEERGGSVGGVRGAATLPPNPGGGKERGSLERAGQGKIRKERSRRRKGKGVDTEKEGEDRDCVLM